MTALAANEPADHKAPDDQKALQGEWIPVKGELGGKPLPDAVLKTISPLLEFPAAVPRPMFWIARSLLRHLAVRYRRKNISAKTLKT